MSYRPYGKLTRRRLLGGGAYLLGGIAVACSTNNGVVEDAADPRREDAGGQPQPGGDAGPAQPPAVYGQEPPGGMYGPPAEDAALACRATRADIEGPFFVPASPERSNLLEDGLSGERLHITGRALDTQCRALADAVLDFWQCDADGVYDGEGFRLRGHVRASADGRYELTTIVPGRYLNGSMYRPAHIHVKAYVNGREVLTTQLYFDGDEYNVTDPWFRPENALVLRGASDTGWEADFDFQLSIA